MRRSDATLALIREKLDAWDRAEFFADGEQYQRFRDIKLRIVQAETRCWRENPPWARVLEEGVGNGVHEKDGRAVLGGQRGSVAQSVGGW